ncbi:MAG: hypothetical protein IAF02_27885 [Anaerolineae bacterium]|nr:hypothetical protein [Anaerolineae bacterium]
MRKNHWANLTWLFLGLLPLLLIACGGGTTSPSATAVPALEVPTMAAAGEEMEGETAVSAKPQLIEFYAEW